MKRVIDLPNPSISELKRIHVDFDMKAKHYEKLVLYNGEAPEQLILEILSDLVEEDVDKLTVSEAMYVFTLIKIANIGDILSVSIDCTNEECKKKGVKIHSKVSISDATIKRVPKDFELPVIKWCIEPEKEETFVIEPVTLSAQNRLIDWFNIEKNIDRKDLFEKKENVTKYNIIYSLMHLSINGKKYIDSTEDFAKAEELLELNTYKKLNELLALSSIVDSFGIVPKTHECKCKECGGTVKFHLPLLYGLSDEHV